MPQILSSFNPKCQFLEVTIWLDSYNSSIMPNIWLINIWWWRKRRDERKERGRNLILWSSWDLEIFPEILANMSDPQGALIKTSRRDQQHHKDSVYEPKKSTRIANQRCSIWQTVLSLLSCSRCDKCYSEFLTCVNQFDSYNHTRQPFCRGRNCRLEVR